MISEKYFLSPTASYMKSEKIPFSFTLFLTDGETAKIVYSNGFSELNEQSNAERVEAGKDGGKFLDRLYVPNFAVKISERKTF